MHDDVSKHKKQVKKHYMTEQTSDHEQSWLKHSKSSMARFSPEEVHKAMAEWVDECLMKDIRTACMRWIDEELMPNVRKEYKRHQDLEEKEPCLKPCQPKDPPPAHLLKNCKVEQEPDSPGGPKPNCPCVICLRYKKTAQPHGLKPKPKPKVQIMHKPPQGSPDIKVIIKTKIGPTLAPMLISRVKKQLTKQVDGFVKME